jgi:hypothetical protein
LLQLSPPILLLWKYDCLGNLVFWKTHLLRSIKDKERKWESVLYWVYWYWDSRILSVLRQRIQNLKQVENTHVGYFKGVSHLRSFVQWNNHSMSNCFGPRASLCPGHCAKVAVTFVSYGCNLNLSAHTCRFTSGPPKSIVNSCIPFYKHNV